ncbi:peroxisomal membrane protein PMP34-like [Corticium candelabrum]|uniref:peroxisomal membrane protein PMP34-like n=1 Tax=Corticium candelabrum TaxID=121492 RepID=UPI002E330A37|nr:peroxisomal membrane protein PMP34-like [Corticium candelabrum]
MNELGCCGIQGIWKRGGAALCMRPRDLSRPRDLRGHPTVDQTSGSMAELFSYSNLVHAVSGAAGSVTAMTVFFPLETARTRLQVDEERRAANAFVALSDIVREEGWTSLYRGLAPVLTGVCCSNFVYFYTFNGLKAVVKHHSIPVSALTDLLMASVAGIVNVVTTTPLWVVNMRMKLQGAKLKSNAKIGARPYTGVLDGLVCVAQQEGIGALWSSVGASLLLVCNPSIQFMIYESLKRIILRDNDTVSASKIFAIGALAKAVATIVTYPLQISQARLRAGLSQSSNRRSQWHIFTRTFNCLQEIVRKHGFAGIYKGLETKLWQTVLTAALMFLCYEKIARFIFSIMGIKK